MEPSTRLTSGNLGRAHGGAKCSGGRQTGSETRAVRRWSWHEKQSSLLRLGGSRCAQRSDSVLFARLGDESVSKRSAHLSDPTHTGSVAAPGCRDVLRGMYFYAPCAHSLPICPSYIAAYLFMPTSFTAPTFNSSSQPQLISGNSGAQCSASARLAREHARVRASTRHRERRH